LPDAELFLAYSEMTNSLLYTKSNRALTPRAANLTQIDDEADWHVGCKNEAITVSKRYPQRFEKAKPRPLL
jgi:hypothetical protein